MIRRVKLTRRATKQLLRTPARVERKLSTWSFLVTKLGVEEVRKMPGFHDEPLVGPRRGTRSIRLSRAYRAICRVVREREAELVSVEEVNKHDY
jgi:proteic killer suppression protein